MHQESLQDLADSISEQGVVQPIVVRAIGARASRRYFLTAERFSAAEAHRIGLVHESVPMEQLDATVQALIKILLANSPMAVQDAKRLVDSVAGQDINEALIAQTVAGIADSRAKMEAILAANPEPGSISAVWAAWDQPALGALQAIEAAGRQGEGIVITGIDANPQAREAIAAGGNFEASVAQDFAGIGAAAADAAGRAMKGETIKEPVIYVSTVMVTAVNAAQ